MAMVYEGYEAERHALSRDNDAEYSDPLLQLDTGGAAAREHASNAKCCSRKRKRGALGWWCGAVLGTVLFVGAAFAVPAWYCCTLFLKSPTVTVDPLSVRPTGFRVNATKLDVAFSLGLTVKLYNPNYLGATVHAARLHVWHLQPNNVIRALRASYLGVATTDNSDTDFAPRATADVPITAGFVSSVRLS